MAVNLSPVGGVAAQFFDNAGNVLTGGKLQTYLAGTTTPQPAYTTAAGNIPWSNPIILDAAGRVSGSGEIWLTDGIQYKFILRDSNDVLIATYDNINGINSNFVAFTGEEETQTATQAQTVFTLTTLQYQPGVNNLLVFVNGSKQVVGTNYQETSGTVVTFASGLNAGDVVDFCTATPINTNAIDAQQVSYNPPFTGAVVTNVEDKLAQYVSVTDFGAVGDGVTDDSAAFQAAVDYVVSLSPVSPSIFIPSGDYVIGTTINAGGAEFFGEGFNTTGTRIFPTASLNAPMFDVVGGARFLNMTILGSNNGANTNESCVRITSSNNAYFDNVTFFNTFRGILIEGSVPVFYVSIQNCRFENSIDGHIIIDNSSGPGVDLMISHCRFLGNMTGSCWRFSNGLGSIIASDIQISVTGAGPIAHLCFFGTPAPSFGGAQFTNVVFESGGASLNSTPVFMLGTALLPWKEMHFDNCLFGTGIGAALFLGDVAGAVFVDCTFASSNTTGHIQFAQFRNAFGLVFVGCRHESLSAAPVFYSPGNHSVSLFISMPLWNGSPVFIDFSLLPPAQVKLDVIGGQIGQANPAILLSDYNNTPKNIQVNNSNYGPVQYAVYTGALDGAGVASITHGITAGNSRIVSVNAFWKGGSAEARPLPITSVDGTAIVVGGGGASSFGQNYRVYVQFVQQAVAW